MSTAIIFWGHEYSSYSGSWVNHIPRPKGCMRLGMEIAIKVKAHEPVCRAIILGFNWVVKRAFGKQWLDTASRPFEWSKRTTNGVAVAVFKNGAWTPAVINRRFILCSWPSFVGHWYKENQRRIESSINDRRQANHNAATCRTFNLVTGLKSRPNNSSSRPAIELDYGSVEAWLKAREGG